MNQDEAIKLIMSKYPNHDVGKITETDEYFIINILPKNSTNADPNGEYDLIDPALCNDGLKAVNKETKSIFTYNPIKHG